MKNKLILYYKKLGKIQPLLGRVFVCWIVGILVLMATQTPNYDLRFKLRGSQATSNEIVLILINHKNWQNLSNNIYGDPNFSPPPEELPEEHLWEPGIWSTFLKQLQKFNPSAIAVNIFFSEELELSARSIKNYDNVFWAAKVDKEDRIFYPKASNRKKSNIGISNLSKSIDGKVKTFSSHYVFTSHLAIKVYNHYKSLSKKYSNLKVLTQTQSSINFRGNKKNYKVLSINDIFSKDFDPLFLQNKIVLIGKANEFVQTPLGEMSRTEVLANIVDNFINNSWITNQNIYISIFILFVIACVCLLIFHTFQQTLSFFYFTAIGIVVSALSLWLFDSHNFWTPLIAPLTQLSFTYVAFISFLLNKKDNQNWMLEQEKKYRNETEELKNNFVSLISHDLKTPIAKIQGICDRLLTEKNPQPQDILLLKNESIELNHYIETILRIIKIEASDLNLQKQPSDINEIINEAYKQLLPLAKSKDISIDMKLEPTFLSEMDPLLIREVIMNLIENAIKYSPQKSTVRIISYEKENHTIVTVIDQGPGIADDDQPLIFNKFYRASAFKNSTKGSGLGLYLVKYFIELHSGKVYLSSKKGKGTAISIYLPLV